MNNNKGPSISELVTYKKYIPTQWVLGRDEGTGQYM